MYTYTYLFRSTANTHYFNIKQISEHSLFSFKEDTCPCNVNDSMAVFNSASNCILLSVIIYKILYVPYRFLIGGSGFFFFDRRFWKSM